MLDNGTAFFVVMVVARVMQFISPMIFCMVSQEQAHEGPDSANKCDDLSWQRRRLRCYLFQHRSTAEPGDSPMFPGVVIHAI